MVARVEEKNPNGTQRISMKKWLVKAARETSKFQNWSLLTNCCRRCMTEIFPKTLSNVQKNVANDYLLCVLLNLEKNKTRYLWFRGNVMYLTNIVFFLWRFLCHGRYQIMITLLFYVLSLLTLQLILVCERVS